MKGGAREEGREERGKGTEAILRGGGGVKGGVGTDEGNGQGESLLGICHNKGEACCHIPHLSPHRGIQVHCMN